MVFLCLMATPISLNAFLLVTTDDPINTDDLLMASDDESDPMMYYIPSNEGEGLFRVETINGGDGLLYFKSNVSLDREVSDCY